MYHITMLDEALIYFHITLAFSSDKYIIKSCCAHYTQFQFLSFSKVCYSFLGNLQFVYSSGNGNIHD